MFYDLCSTAIRVKTSLWRAPNPASAQVGSRSASNWDISASQLPGGHELGMLRWDGGGGRLSTCYPSKEQLHCETRLQLEFPSLQRAKPRASRMCGMCAHWW